MIKKQVLSLVLLSSLLLPSLTCLAGATDISSTTDLDTLRALFFQSTQTPTAVDTSDVVEPLTNDVIAMPQLYPAIEQATDGDDQRVSSAAAQAYTIDYSLGDTRDFDVFLSTYQTSSGTLVAQGEHVNLWLIDQTAGSQGTLSEANYQNIITRYTAIYELMSAQLAEHAGVLYETGYSSNSLPYVGDIGEDGRVNILLYDIDENGDSSGSYVAGYFYSRDLFASSAGGAIDAVHMDIGTNHGYKNLTEGDGDTFFGTLAHEYQHMLFYIYCGWKLTDGTSTLSWFNESLSGLTDMYYSTGVEGQEQIPDKGKMTLSNLNSYAVGSTYGDFLNFNNGFKNYGMSYLLSAMMQQHTQGTYGNSVYDYFKTIERDDYSGTTDIDTLVGNVFKAALGEPFEAWSPEDVFSTIYYLLMENYITDGGAVVVGDQSYNTYSLWNGDKLWSKKDLANCGYTGYDTLYDQLSSGDTFSLVGDPYDNSTIQASHERTFNLEKSTDTPYLNITVDQADGLMAYVALYDETTQTADLYPLALGEANGIETHNKKAYLFVSTLYQDVEDVSVSFQWSQTRIIPSGTATSSMVNNETGGLTLTATFDMDAFETQTSDLMVGFYQDGQLVDVQTVRLDSFEGEHQFTLTQPDASFNGYKLFLCDATWDFKPLLTQTELQPLS